MDIEEIHEYCLSKKHTTAEFPFDEDTLVFKVAGKMFAAIGLKRDPLAINLKADPEKAIEQRVAYPHHVFPGYHMSKKHWNTVILSGFPAATTKKMIDESYELVIQKMPKKSQRALGFID